MAKAKRGHTDSKLHATRTIGPASTKPALDADQPSPHPGFVLCAARSGSTLLRLILNSHPEIACPPETNLVQVISAIGFSVMAASEAGGNSGADSAIPERLQSEAARISRDVADRILGAYARDREKPMWVDKSLPSVLFADMLARVFPDGRFICLYRQCPDTVASLHEASTWSYDSFGVLPFVQASPTNIAQALTAYWVDRVTRMQTFEDAHPGQTLRVRYEDLATQPEDTVAQILRFLGVNADQSAVAAALAFQSKSTAMPGDVKVRFSRGVNSDSVGRGWSVPLDMLDDDMRERVDELSSELGYRALPNLRQYTTEPATPLISTVASAGPHSQEVTRLLEERVAIQGRASAPRPRSNSSALMKLVLTDLPEPWIVDFTSGRLEKRDGKAAWLALTDSQTLLSLVAGQSNPGMAMKNSQLQIVSASDQVTPDQFLDRVDDLMTVLRG